MTILPPIHAGSCGRNQLKGEREGLLVVLPTTSCMVSGLHMFMYDAIHRDYRNFILYVWGRGGGL